MPPHFATDSPNANRPPATLWYLAACVLLKGPSRMAGRVVKAPPGVIQAGSLLLARDWCLDWLTTPTQLPAVYSFRLDLASDFRFLALALRSAANFSKCRLTSSRLISGSVM